MVVRNPAPADCSSLPSKPFMIFDRPTVTAAVPDMICTADGAVNGIPARGVTVSADGTSAVADMSGLLTAGGPYDVTISNGTGCSSTLSAAVTVVNGPQVFFYDPSVAYNGVSIEGTLYGSGFSGAVQSASIKTASGAAMVGVGYRLGPGALLGELRFGFTPVSQKVTGSSNIAALSLLLGYGLFI